MNKIRNKIITVKRVLNKKKIEISSTLMCRYAEKKIIRK